MTVKWLVSAAVLAVASGLFVRPAAASSTGIFDQAKAGCTCHGPGIGPSPSTRVFVLGLPDGSDPTKPTGYVPGRKYPIQVLVFGLSDPPLGAGFNLWPTTGNRFIRAGDLESADTDSQVREDTECQRLERQYQCIVGVPTNDCEVVINPGCPAPDFDLANAACEKCPRAELGTSACRACDDTTILDVQATHTHPHSQPFMWNLTWTAPAAGTGPVKFYLAGNVVNANGNFDVGDLWSMLGSDPLEPVITIPEGETPPALTLPAPLPAH